MKISLADVVAGEKVFEGFWGRPVKLLTIDTQAGSVLLFMLESRTFFRFLLHFFFLYLFFVLIVGLTPVSPS